MEFAIAFKFLLVVALCSKFAHGYLICGDNIDISEIAYGKATTIRRLNAYKLPDGSWENTGRIALIMQLTARDNMTDIKKTINFVKTDIWKNLRTIPTPRLSEMAMFLRIACEDSRNVYGIDLLKTIDNNLRTQFIGHKKAPRGGFSYYSISLAALCTSEYPIIPRLVDDLLNTQARDGSFGDTIELTGEMGLILYCMTQLKDPVFDKRPVEIAAARAREYIISQLYMDVYGKFHLGLDGFRPLSMLFLSKTSRACENSDRWACLDMLQTYGPYPSPDESEHDLGTRLLLLDAMTYTNILDSKCHPH